MNLFFLLSVLFIPVINSLLKASERNNAGQGTNFVRIILRMISKKTDVHVHRCSCWPFSESMPLFQVVKHSQLVFYLSVSISVGIRFFVTNIDDRNLETWIFSLHILNSLLKNESSVIL